MQAFGTYAQDLIAYIHTLEVRLKAHLWEAWHSISCHFPWVDSEPCRKATPAASRSRKIQDLPKLQDELSQLFQADSRNTSTSLTPNNKSATGDLS